MSVFLYHHKNKVDAKGRVSLPADFRAAVADSGFSGVFLNIAIDPDCIEGFGQNRLQDIIDMIDGLPDFDEEREEIESTYFSASQPLLFDSDGRIVLSQALRDHAGIGDMAMFVGMGRHFQIWSPEVYEARKEELYAAGRKHKGKLLGRAARERAAT